ncbi:MAG TPA: hypothetical protein VF329_14915 [Gammaproteobacteria bacterium]
MSNANHNHGTIQSTTDGRDAASGKSPAAGKRQAPKRPRFGWLFDESILQGFLLVAVLVALVGGYSSINHIPFA